MPKVNPIWEYFEKKKHYNFQRRRVSYVINWYHQVVPYQNNKQSTFQNLTCLSNTHLQNERFLITPAEITKKQVLQPVRLSIDQKSNNKHQATLTQLLMKPPTAKWSDDDLITECIDKWMMGYIIMDRQPYGYSIRRRSQTFGFCQSIWSETIQIEIGKTLSHLVDASNIL